MVPVRLRNLTSLSVATQIPAWSGSIPLSILCCRVTTRAVTPPKALDIKTYWGRYLRGPGEIAPLLSYIADRNESDPFVQRLAPANGISGADAGAAASVRPDQPRGLGA